MQSAWAQVGAPSAGLLGGPGWAMLPGAGTGEGKVCFLTGRAGRRGLGDALCRAPGAGKGGGRGSGGGGGGACWREEGWPPAQHKGHRGQTSTSGSRWRVVASLAAQWKQRPPADRGTATRARPGLAGPSLFRDALRKCAPADAGWGGSQVLPAGSACSAAHFPLLWQHCTRPHLEWCVSPWWCVPEAGCISLCVLLCFWVSSVCDCAFPLCVIASLGVSSRLGPSVFAVGVGVCERLSGYLCLSIAVCGSFCLRLYVF